MLIQEEEIVGSQNGMLYKFFYTDKSFYNDLKDINQDIKEAFDNNEIAKFIDKSILIMSCFNYIYLCKYKNMYYVVDAKDGGGISGAGNKIQNCLNTIINMKEYLNLFSDKQSNQEIEDAEFFIEQYQEAFCSDFNKDLIKYKEMCKNIDLEYSDNQKFYQHEIDEFDELMKDLGIYE